MSLGLDGIFEGLYDPVPRIAVVSTEHVSRTDDSVIFTLNP